MIRDLVIDDYLAFVGDGTGQVNKVMGAIQHFRGHLGKSWEEGVELGYNNTTRPCFAEWAKHYDCSGFLFYKYDHPERTAAMYIDNIPIRKLKEIVDKEMEIV